MAKTSEPYFQMNPLQEQWPNIRFMGLGAWWAWIWLCYGSTVVMSLFPAGTQPERVFEMYALSTPAIGCCMLLAAVFSGRVEAAMEKYDKALCFVFGLFASICTLVMELSGLFDSTVAFCIFAALTGIGTSYLCLRAGKLYGSVGLAESLTAGAISLIFAGLLYFMGVALPYNLGAYFAAAMPIVAAVLLSMNADDSFTVINSPDSLPSGERKVSMRALVSVSVAGGLIALTAGFGKGISAIQASSNTFAEQGVLGTTLIVVIGILILWAINKHGAVFAITNGYTALIVMGIAVMIGMCFGLPAAYLTVGKESLWLVLSVLLAYLAFRYSISPVRVFGIGQAVYFFCSTIGWIVGYLLGPYYSEFTVAVGASLAMVFMIVLVVLYVLPSWRIKHIVQSGATVQYATQQTPVRKSASTPDQSQVADIWDAAKQDFRIKKHDYLHDGVHSTFTSTEPMGAMSVADSTASEDSYRDNEVANDQSNDGFDYGRAADAVYGLSARELEIMALFAQGRSANWIAENQCISKNTVRTHLRSVYAKLDVHTRQELLDFIAGK